MYFYSQNSKKRLSSADPMLQTLFNEVIKRVDITIIFGHRTKEEQEAQFVAGNTKLHYPQSKHNSMPSQAVDAAPYPIDWKNLERFADTAKIIFDTWDELKKAGKVTGFLRWGGNWKSRYDATWKIVKWLDMPHWELSKQEWR